MEPKSSYRTTEENKRLILRAATGLLLRKGYIATTLREVAKEAGVNIGSLMYRYASTENILCDLV